MTYAIEMEGLKFAYPATEALASPSTPSAPGPWVIGGIDLAVQTGECLAIMGASDVGKTTLCLLLAGLAPHLTGGTMQGRIVVMGRDTCQQPPPALSDIVGILFQEPEAQLFNPTVEDEVAWGLENLGLPSTEIRTRIETVLSVLRLGHARQRAPSSLSGGEKKRLALASVLAMRPAVLILDEPMGGLDPVGQQEVLDTLTTLRHEVEATIVLTESDPEAVAACADRLVVLHRPPATQPTDSRGAILALEGTPRSLFQRVETLASLGVAPPQLARVAATLNSRLATNFDFLTLEEARAALARHLGSPSA
jgi:energy-coupling factor transporter ATP-binding protein EcfA2